MPSTGLGSCCLLMASHCQFHLFLILGVFNRARIMFGISDLPLPIPSDRNYLFLVYGFKIMFNIAGLSLTNPFLRNYLFFPQNVFNKARVLLGVPGLPIPSHRNYLCLLHDVLSWTRIILDVTDVLMTIPSTRNHLYLPYGAFNRPE